MTSIVTGTTWRAEYGEIGEQLQFRVGYVGSSTYQEAFPIAGLPDIIAVLTGVGPLSPGQTFRGSAYQAAKLNNWQQDITLSFLSYTSAPALLQLYSADRADLVSVLTSLQAQLGTLTPADWDGSEPAASGGSGGGGGGGGSVNVTVSDTQPASGLWLDTSNPIPNVIPVVDVSASSFLLDATATWTVVDVDLDTPLTVVLDWGDGTVVTSPTSPATHAYPDSGVYAITVTATDTRGGVGSDTYLLSVFGPAENYPEEVLFDEPEFYFRLNETSGPVIADSGPNGLDGTVVGAVTFNQGSLLGDGTGSSILFPGTIGNAISLPPDSAEVTPDAQTVEFRVRTLLSPNDQFFCGIWGAPIGHANQWLIRTTATGFLKLEGYGTAAAAGATATTMQFVANTTYTVAVTIGDNLGLKAFVNGVKVIEAGPPNSSWAPEPTNIYLGGTQIGAMGNVRLSDFSLYHKILSEARLAERHAAAIAP